MDTPFPIHTIPLEVDIHSTTQIDLEPKTIQLEVDIRDARDIDKTHQKPSKPHHPIVFVRGQVQVNRSSKLN
ncbi:hypothetical protein PGT21_021944 [Puccinia graminis f. sp. tritici]|uniref:Uncharacterized protein n=1 Tax=Puccinia graminis f. sp. tritici TaxID=56615 RepID=A0A5B0PSB5_PUCGR|nr:hypothetical protein PGT21_021944 [Puccinia graminis f. sp. tritici]